MADHALDLIVYCRAKASADDPRTWEAFEREVSDLQILTTLFTDGKDSQ